MASIKTPGNRKKCSDRSLIILVGKVVSRYGANIGHVVSWKDRSGCRKSKLQDVGRLMKIDICEYDVMMQPDED